MSGHREPCRRESEKCELPAGEVEALGHTETEDVAVIHGLTRS
jgi:hypothetical protein